MNNAMGKLQSRGIFLYDLRRALIQKEFCVYVVSIVGYQDYQDRCRPHKKKKLDFHTRGTECVCAQ